MILSKVVQLGFLIFCLVQAETLDSCALRWEENCMENCECIWCQSVWMDSYAVKSCFSYPDITLDIPKTCSKNYTQCNTRLAQLEIANEYYDSAKFSQVLLFFMMSFSFLCAIVVGVFYASVLDIKQKHEKKMTIKEQLFFIGFICVVMMMFILCLVFAIIIEERPSKLITELQYNNE